MWLNESKHFDITRFSSSNGGAHGDISKGALIPILYIMDFVEKLKSLCLPESNRLDDS